MAGRVKIEKRGGDLSSEVNEKKRKLKKIHKEGKTVKKVTVEIDGKNQTLGNLEATKEHVVNCVEAILKLAEKNANKNALLSDGQKIFLQINSIKVPNAPQRYLRIYLPHTMVGPNDDVALFVPDLRKGRRQDYEKTIDHWETILRQNGVTTIKDIIPMNKVKTEYNQYEMRRKLARLYDFFLIDGRIAGHMSHLLGKTFTRRARPPIPIKLHRTNLKEEIDSGLKKACIQIHGNGSTHSIQVAATSMSKEIITENILAACEGIKKLYPGGLDNVRSILIKTEHSLAIPIYYSIKNKNQVEVPKVVPKRPKAFKTVEGELSTAVGDIIVQVKPGGQVIIKR